MTNQQKCDICGRDNLTERELDMHKRYYHKVGGQPRKVTQPAQKIASGACPDCGATLWYQEGCASCPGCGYSKCG